MLFNVALLLLHGLDVCFISLFFIWPLVVEEELIVVKAVEIDDGLLVILVDVNPFFLCFGHLLIFMGDHPNELGGKIMKLT